MHGACFVVSEEKLLSDSTLVEAREASDEDLLVVHTRRYLNELKVRGLAAEGTGPGGGQPGGGDAGSRGSAPVPAQGERVSLWSPLGARGPRRAGTRVACGAHTRGAISMS